MPIDCITFDAMSGDGARELDEPEAKDSDGGTAGLGPVDREFTCTACGFAPSYEVARLQAEVHAVCANCGDWTTQLADDRVLVEAAKNVANALAGPTLTERQALAYVLRDVMDVDRQTAANVLESTPSNVDNLQRKATEKLEDAQRVLAGLDELRESA